MVLTFLFLAGSFSYISYINIEVKIAGNEERLEEFGVMAEEVMVGKVFWRKVDMEKMGRKRYWWLFIVEFSIFHPDN